LPLSWWTWWGSDLLCRDGRLSGLLDFELSHRNVCVAEFDLAWRGVSATGLQPNGQGTSSARML
jgi:hypothetical protein